MVGEWRLATADGGHQCKIDLKSGGSAWVPGGCPDGFFGASIWKIDGGELQIGTRFDQAGSFRAVGRDRWEGSSAKDGAAVVLSR